MTDDLRDKLRALVVDPPAPTGVPSEAVFARVRTIRRRRATGAAVLATAAVAAIVVTAGNITGVDSAPPVTKTPNQPQTIITGPPTVSPTTTPTRTPKGSISATVNTLPPVENSTNTPPTADPSSPSTQPSSPGTTPPPRMDLFFWPYPTIDGLTVTMRVAARGTVLAPTFEEGGTLEAANFHDNLLFAKYWWGDNTYIEDTGSGGMSCYGAKKPVSGNGTKQVGQPHTYRTAGTYLFAYRITYCSPNGPREYTQAFEVTVSDPASPSPGQ
jgi:hypothetical protein